MAQDYHIRVKYLKEEVKTTKDVLDVHSTAWKKTGCTMMTNGELTVQRELFF